MRNHQIPTSLLLAVIVFQLSCGGSVAPVSRDGRSPELNASAPQFRHDAVSVADPLWEILPLRADDVIPPLKYSTEVGADGSATIQIPIWTPPGRNGVQPNLSLAYSSRSGSGLAGAGFQLTGLASIERCWKTPATDGQFSDSEVADGFCLSGRRLIQDPNGDLFPEGEPGTRVRALPTLQDPKSFTVESADGVVAYFGSRADEATSSNAVARAATTTLVPSELGSDLFVAAASGQRTVIWYVDRVEDRWGNFMLVDYEQLLGPSVPQSVEVRPLRISYTGHKNLPTTREITFLYGPALNPHSRKIARVPVVSSGRLREIQVSAEERLSFSSARPTTRKVQRRYVLEYQAPEPRPIDRLVKVTEFFGTSVNEVAGTPLVLTWSGINKSKLPTFTTRESISSDGKDLQLTTSAHEYRLLFDLLDAAVGDFNGDGFDDYLVRTPNGFVQRGNVNGNATVIASAQYRLSLGGPNGLTTPQDVSLPASFGSDNALSPRVLDLDGDGRDEVVVQKAQLNPSSPAYTPDEVQDWDAFSFNGTDFVALSLGEVLGASPRISNTPARSANLLFGDLNGDGFTDLLSLDGPINTPPVTGGLRIRFGGRTNGSFTLSPGTTVPLSSQLFFPAAGEEKHLLDVDGSGALNFLARSPQDVSVLSDNGLRADLMSYSVTSAAQISGRPTSLWSRDLGHSLAAAAARQFPQCGTATDRQFFSRLMMDVDGDGLRDSVSLPTQMRDTCAVAKHWDGTFLTSLNLGGMFLAPRAQVLPSSISTFISTTGSPIGLVSGPINDTYRLVIGPSVVDEVGQQWFDPDSEETKLLEDRARSSTRTIDNGVRVVDFDGDGREDILVVGDLVGVLRHGTLARNMVLFQSNGLGFDEPIELPLAAARSLSFPYLDETDTQMAYSRGSGPRSARMGDFNGDGQFDIAFVAWNAIEPDPLSRPIARIVTHVQDPRPPDVITDVSGGLQTPTVKFKYDFLGARTPNRLARTPCGLAQRCPTRFGWVVTELSQEANDFDGVAPELLVTKYRYGTPVLDIRGRGFLGFSSREVESEGLTEKTTMDFNSRFPARPASGADVPYVYDGAVTRVVSIVSGIHSTNVVRSTSSSTRTFGLGRAGLALASTQETTIVNEGPSLTQTRKSKTTTQRDAYGHPIDVLTEWMDASDTVVSSHHRSVGGNDLSADSKWLISRYERVLETSVELTDDGPVTTIRTTGLEYEPDSVEVKVTVVEPDADDDKEGQNGLKLRTEFVRDLQGNVTSIVASSALSSRTTTFDYDQLDQQFPIRSTNPEGHEVRYYAHMGLGVRFATDDPNGLRQRASHDAFLRARRVVSGVLAADDVTQGGDTQTFRYTKLQAPNPFSLTRSFWLCADSSASGQQCSLIDPAGRATEQTWNHYDGTTSKTLKYDRLGRLTSESLPRNDVRQTPVFVTRSFDRLGRIVSQERPGESLGSARLAQSWVYPPSKTDHSDERNVRTVTSLDPKGRIKSTSTFDPKGRAVVVEYKYTTFDQIERTIHPPLNEPMTPAPASLQTTVSYDVLGRPISLDDPDLGAETRLYTPFGDLRQTTDANEGVTVFQRDLLGRATHVDTAPSRYYRNGRSNAFTWDTATHGVGSLASSTSTDGVSTSYSYDQFGREALSTWTIGGQDYSFSRDYDSVGRLRILGYPVPIGAEPFAVRFEYGINGAVRSVFDLTKSALNSTSHVIPELLWHGISMHSSGALEEQQFGSQVRDVRRFDLSHQLRYVESRNTISNAPLQQLSYTWESGFISSKTDLLVQATETYGHDFLGRLSSWRVEQNCGLSEWTYHYDDLNNLRRRERKQGAGVDVVNTFTTLDDSLHPHSVKQVATGGALAEYEYLPGGQASRAKGFSIEWTPFGLPSLVSDSNSATAYLYDAANSRVRTVETSGTGVRDVVSVGGLFEQESTSGGSVYTYNVPGPEGLLGQVRRGVSGREVRFFHADHLGTADTITDAAGGLVERVKFEPFGERRHPWAIAQPMSDSMVLTPIAGFTGHKNADHFGLTDMRGRVYDSAAAGFLSADPIPHSGPVGLGRVSYVRNSPVMRVDPSGFDDSVFTEEQLDRWAQKYVTTVTDRRPRSEAQNLTGQADQIPQSNDQGTGDREGGSRLAADHKLEALGVGLGAFGKGVAVGLGITLLLAEIPVLAGPAIVVGVVFLTKEIATGGVDRFVGSTVRLATRIGDGKMTIDDVEELGFGVGTLVGGLGGAAHVKAVAGARGAVLSVEGAAEAEMAEAAEVCSPGCFPAGTEVSTPTGLVAIETLRLGDVVDSSVPCGESPGLDVEIVLDVETATSGEVVRVVLLRSRSWLSSVGAEFGREFFLSLADVGVEGLARVVGLRSRAPHFNGGCIVTGTIVRGADRLVELQMSGGHSLRLTPSHRLYSATRGAWVAAGDLRRGELLSTARGVTVVAGVEVGAFGGYVYNLEVSGSHEYQVGVARIRAHNVCACAAEAGGSRLVGANRAVIDPRKLTDYALNPSHPVGGNKARVFEKLGFNQGNAGELMQQLRTGVMENTPIPGKVDQFGVRFTVDIPVVGPAGNGVVRTGWIFKTGSTTPELTTLFVK